MRQDKHIALARTIAQALSLDVPILRIERDGDSYVVWALGYSKALRWTATARDRRALARPPRTPQHGTGEDPTHD